MWDQTDRTWLVGVNPDEELGTGLYLVPDPRPNDPDAVRKVLDQDITYNECRTRGDTSGARAIKWVPHTIASYPMVTSTACGAPCQDTCVEFGCVCNERKQLCA